MNFTLNVASKFWSPASCSVPPCGACPTQQWQQCPCMSYAYDREVDKVQCIDFSLVTRAAIDIPKIVYMGLIQASALPMAGRDCPCAAAAQSPRACTGSSTVLLTEERYKYHLHRLAGQMTIKLTCNADGSVQLSSPPSRGDWAEPNNFVTARPMLCTSLVPAEFYSSHRIHWHMGIPARYVSVNTLLFYCPSITRDARAQQAEASPARH